MNQQQSPKLASSFEGLSQLLRYVIEETKSEKVPIHKEIDFIKNYCNLQLLRFEEKEVNLIFEVKGVNNKQLVEPGLFIPFVENAFKYGAEPEVTSSIKIQFDLSLENEVSFITQNKRIPLLQKNNNSPGTGISQTQARLNLVYPDKHLLEIKDEDVFLVKLKIETN